MSRRFARLAKIVVVAFTLSACGIVYWTPFPQFSSLIQNKISLDQYFSVDPISDYRIAAYDDGTTEYVLLLARGGTSGERLLIFDEDLELRYRTDDLPSDTRPLLDWPIVANQAGQLFVGRLAFPAGIGTPTMLSANNLEWRSTLYDSSTNDLISIVTESGALKFATVPGTPDSGAIGPSTMMVDAFGGQYEDVIAAYSLASGAAGLAVVDGGNSVVAGFIGTTSTVLSANIGAGPDLAGTAGGYSFFVAPPASGPARAHPTPTGVVVEHADEGIYLTYYDYSGNEGEQIYHDQGGSRITFSMAGAHFYLFDPDLNSIIKARTWW